jgi:hypothetical protein
MGALTCSRLGLGGETPDSAPKPADASSASPTAARTGATTPQDELALLKKQVIQQQAQIDQLLHSIHQLERQLAAPNSAPSQEPVRTPDPGLNASLVPVIPTTAPSVSPAAVPTAAGIPNPQHPETEAAPSPLQLKVGTAYITPVGFMDFTGMYRSKDVGSGIGTNFGSIPYGSSAYQGNLSEFRFNMQNSRIGFRVDADVKGAHVIGYMEADFLGNNPGNVAVSSNSNTLRSRLYWADLQKGSWEVLGGQTWSLITPGRTGISPVPADVFYTQDMDVNYQAGLVWGRIPELRFVYHHPSNKAAFAIALDSPEQYVGGSSGGSLDVFPSALNTAYSGELNVGTNTLGVPNGGPDVIAKLALDPSKQFHFEVGGVERDFKVWNPTNSLDYRATGGGGFVNLNFELFKGFRILTNNFWSDGGGRYIFGQAPDLIAHADGSISLIHADSTVSGFEYTNKNTLVYSYYGGVYVGRNIAIDTNGKPVGYGYTGSSSGQNKSIQEGTFGIIQTFWKNPRYGALSLITQYSYLTRSPWYVASGQPKDAHLNMVFLDLRYSLPGSAPIR